MAAQRVFISYRHVAQDQRLAELLYDRFTAAGHDVFIDRRITVGTDWVAEIDDRIAWCATMVLLLSEDAAKSEMVQQEVLTAKSLGKTLLPVRVVYTGQLDYRLASHLDRIQYLIWQSEADDEATVAALLNALAGGDLPERAVAIADQAKPIVLTDRPVSSADPRVLQQPDLQLDDPCYLRRDSDARVMARIENSAGLTIIKAPRQMGKTSLVLRYLAASEAKGKRKGYIDFFAFEKEELTSLPATLAALQRELLDTYKINGAGLAPPTTISAMRVFMETTVFIRCPEPLALALDDIDQLAGKPPQDNIFAMLRDWKNRAATHGDRGWNRLDLILAVATEPAAFITDATQSPFNVEGSEPERLQVFDRPAIETLAKMFTGGFAAPEIDLLQSLTGGHPYLVRASLWRLFGRGGGGYTLAQLEAMASDDDGPFSEHLKAKLALLHRQPENLEALRKLIRDGLQPTPVVGYRLAALGLVKTENGKRVPANRLYERYFKRMLLH